MTTLGEYAAIQGGFAYKSHDFVAEPGMAVLKIKNVRQGFVDYADSSYVSDETARATAKWFTAPGDILISMTGSGPSAPESLVGRVARVWEQEPRALINQRVGRLRLKEASHIYPDFLFYLLSQKEIQNFLVANSTGSANQVNISSKTIEAAPCPRVGFSESKEIALFLNAFDQRVRLLRETNATLEAIAQALFKSWFVDFDPVRAKMEGRIPEGMDDATAALFPNGLEDSELGMVPTGWRFARIDEFMELAYGKALKATDRIYGEVPVYGSGGITGFHNESLVTGPSIIIGRKGTVGSLYWEDQPFFAIDTVFYVRTANPMTYCFYLLKTLGLTGMNTDAAVPGLNRGNVYRLTVPFPGAEILGAFDANASVIRKRIFSNSLQAQTLATLRDTLLPRLISGALRLPEAQAVAEEVLA